MRICIWCIITAYSCRVWTMSENTLIHGGSRRPPLNIVKLVQKKERNCYWIKLMCCGRHCDTIYRFIPTYYAYFRSYTITRKHPCIINAKLARFRSVQKQDLLFHNNDHGQDRHGKHSNTNLKDRTWEYSQSNNAG